MAHILLSTGQAGHNFGLIDSLTTFEDTDLLINLRNGYTHYIPWSETVLRENILIEEFDAQKIEKLRQKLKQVLPLNKLLSIGTMKPFFPEMCLGYECATWAVTTSWQFVEEFFQQLNKTFPYSHVRLYLKT